MNAPSILYRAGVGFYASMTQVRGRQHVATLFKCDRLTEQQREVVRAAIPDVQFLTGRAEYAPELRFDVVSVPTDAERRRMKKTNKGETK